MTRIVDKVAWTPVRNRAVLFARTRGQTLFYTVGGKRKPGETDEEALVREVKEEAGVELLLHTVRYRNTFLGTPHGMPDGTVLKLACYTGETSGAPQPNSEIEELQWFTTADTKRTTETGQAVLKWLAEKGLID